MYEKDLSQTLRVRVSSSDYSFLQKLSSDRGLPVSFIVRSIIGEYRRSLQTLDVLSRVLEDSKDADLETDFNDQL